MHEYGDDRREPLDLESQAKLFKPLYLRVWKSVLSTFLNWSDERIDEWSSRWEKGLDNVAYGGLFYHETALSYVVRPLIPEILWKRLTGLERNNLKGRLEKAISLGDSAIEMDPTVDWVAAKQRAEAVLMDYEERLPRE